MNARLSPTFTRGAAGTLLAIVLLLSGNACGLPDRATPCDPATPAAPWVTRLPGAGEPMFAGLTVPSGAALVGRAFPDIDGRVEALLLVTGCDPVGTFRDLVARIERAGFDVTSTRPDGHVCLLEGSGPSHTARRLPVDSAVPPDMRLESVVCGANGKRPAAGSGSQPEGSINAGLLIPIRYPADRPLVIRLRNKWIQHGPPVTTDVAIPSPVVPLRLVQPPASIPAQGEGADKFTVVPGSRLVTPPLDPTYGAHIGACDSGGLTVLEVTGDPERIHQEYVRQGLKMYRSGREDSTFRGGSVEVLRFSVSGRRAGLYIETFVEPGRPTFTRIERCVD